MQQKKGLFIVFEGIDGSGTTTHSKLLRDNFKNINGNFTDLTFEPSDTNYYGRYARELITKEITLKLSDSKIQESDHLSDLFVLDRRMHLFDSEVGITNCLNQGNNVICTRYIMSNLAYNAKDESTSRQKIVLNNENFPLPDVLIYLECEIDTAMKRLSQRDSTDLYETEKILTRVKQRYDFELIHYAGKYLRISTENYPKGMVADNIVKGVKQILGYEY